MNPQDMLIYIFTACGIIMLASLIGKLTTWRIIGPWVEKNLSYLVSFSAGVFIVITIQLARESVEHSASLYVALVAIVSGFVLLHLFSALFPEAHHHHETNDPADVHHAASGSRILISDALHNMGDGFLLAPAFLISPTLGIMTAVGIFVHELAQEVSEFFVLRQAGYSIGRALTLNFIVSSSILVGALLSYFLAQTASILGPLLGITAGTFLYVVSRDLIPHSIQASKRERSPWPFVIAGFCGILFFLTVSTLIGHE